MEVYNVDGNAYGYPSMKKFDFIYIRGCMKSRQHLNGFTQHHAFGVKSRVLHYHLRLSIQVYKWKLERHLIQVYPHI